MIVFTAQQISNEKDGMAVQWLAQGSCSVSGFEAFCMEFVSPCV